MALWFEARTASLLIKKRDLSVCLSVCLSGYTFRHALMSHSDILDSDRGHIFRKHRHKNNKKVAVIYEKMVKTGRCQGICPPVAMLTRSAYVYSAISRVHFAYTRDITSKAYARSDAKILRANGGLPPGRWPCMIGLRVRAGSLMGEESGVRNLKAKRPPKM